MKTEIGADAGTHNEPDAQAGYLRAHKATRNRLLKQFCKLESGNFANDAYREGWERIFGSTNATKPPEPGEESGT